MKGKSKKKIFLYIAFIVLTLAALSVVIFFKLNQNILIGSWESEDKARLYRFDENTLTITFADSKESVLYGYALKNNKELVLSKGGKNFYYDIFVGDNSIAISSADTDSPEILHRVYE